MKHSCSQNISIGDSVKIIGRKAFLIPAGELSDISGTYLVIGKRVSVYSGRIDLIIKVDENPLISNLASPAGFWGAGFGVSSIYSGVPAILIDDHSEGFSSMTNCQFEKIIAIYKRDQNVS